MVRLNHTPRPGPWPCLGVASSTPGAPGQPRGVSEGWVAGNLCPSPPVAREGRGGYRFAYSYEIVIEARSMCSPAVPALTLAEAWAPVMVAPYADSYASAYPL